MCVSYLSAIIPCPVIVFLREARNTICPVESSTSSKPPKTAAKPNPLAPRTHISLPRLAYGLATCCRLLLHSSLGSSRRNPSAGEGIAQQDADAAVIHSPCVHAAARGLGHVEEGWIKVWRPLRESSSRYFRASSQISVRNTEYGVWSTCGCSKIFPGSWT